MSIFQTVGKLGRFSYLKASRSHGILSDELIGVTVLLYDAYMSERLDIRVRIYEMLDGKPLEPLLDYPLSYFGSCPNVGDTIALKRLEERKLYSVSRRYHVYLRGWAVIVRKVEPSAQTDAVLKSWEEDDDWEDEIDAEEAIERQKELERQIEHVKLLTGRAPAEFDLDHREEPVIKKLARKGPGIRFPCRTFTDFGEGTRSKLVGRGFIEVTPSKSGKFKDDEISLTDTGAKAWKELVNFRKKVEAAKTKGLR